LIGDRIIVSGQFPITARNYTHPVLQAFFIHKGIQISELPDGKIKLVVKKLDDLCDLNGYLLHNSVDINNQHYLDFTEDFGFNPLDPIVLAKKELLAELKEKFSKINKLIPAPQLEPLKIAEEAKSAPTILNDDQLDLQAGMLGMLASALQTTKKLYKKIINPL